LVWSEISYRFFSPTKVSEIEETDLLFIDSLHTYKRMTFELETFAPKVKPYIVAYDTTLYSSRGEDGAPNYFFMNSGKYFLNESAGNTHITSVWQRDLLAKIGGYTLWQGEDQKFHAALKAAKVWEDHAPIPWSEVYYLYRWGVSPHHLSGTGDIPKHWDQLGEQAAPQGTFKIELRWHRDYSTEVAAFVENSGRR
jgi:hypothetical protein